MSAYRAVIAAFSMFSRIPVPRQEWGAAAMRHAMAAFPLVGVAIGAALAGWEALATFLSLGPIMRGTGFCLLPLAVSGGVHMDGFCDVVDARASHGDAETKRRILKDPHTGAFAAVAAAAYLIAFTAAGTEWPRGHAAALCLGLIFVLSRALTGLAVVFLPCAAASGLGRSFHDAADARTAGFALGFAAAGSIALLIRFGGVAGCVVPVAAAWEYCRLRRVAAREFGGMSGDLAGWFLQRCELASVWAFVIAARCMEAGGAS